MIRRILTALWLAIIAAAAGAQSLSPAQLATACTACKGDATCGTARLAGNVMGALNWLNAERTPQTLAWGVAVPSDASDEAANYTTFDSLTAGKRDSWAIFLRTQRNFSKNKVRTWVTDVWGAATASSVAEAILQAATVRATNLQNAIGGTAKSTGTVSALDLTYPYLAQFPEAEWLINPANCN